MTLPAEEPGTPLEPSGNRRPREMVAHDRIRLTGLLPKTPANAGVFYLPPARPGLFAFAARAGFAPHRAWKLPAHPEVS
jgi:hypothetical protein